MKENLNNCQIDIDNIVEEQWSNYLNQFADASIYQTFSYGVVRWGHDNISHLVLKKNDDVIAIAQVAIKKIPFINAGIAYLPWGPLWKKNYFHNNVENLQLMLLALKNQYAVKRGLLLRIKPNDFTVFDERLKSCYLKHGFKYQSEKKSYRTLLVPLTASEEDLRKNFSQKWRNQLNKAEKNNLDVMEGTNDEMYQTFLVLQKEMLSRKGYVPGVDYNQYAQIQHWLPEKLKMKIFICYFEGEPLCASIFSAIGKIGIYLLGATGDKGMKLNGSNLLQWRIMQWLKKQGCEWYDLGGINPNTNPGVYHYKSKIAGKTGLDVSQLGEFEFCNNIKSKLLIKYGEALKK